VLVIVGLYLILVLEAVGRRRTQAVSLLCFVLFVLYVLVLAFPGTRSFFELGVPSAWVVLASLGGAGVAIAGLALTDDRFVPPLRSLESERRRRPGKGRPVA
jgi:cation-transporting P-type ATPase E